MKIARVRWNDAIHLALVNEQERRATLLHPPAEAQADPIRHLIETGLLPPATSARTVALDELQFLSPFANLARNVIAVGKNYHEHALEFDRSGYNATVGASAGAPAFPQIFSKATTSLAGPGDAIRYDPAHTNEVDYEGEIGVVIGRRCRNLSREDAMGAVFGFVLLNDVTARDLQKNHVQWFLGKSLDTFCPMGPWITTPDEAPVESLRVRTWVNDELRQDAPLTQLIFDLPTLLVTLSRTMTLLPGDVIATGTPVGVGIGYTPPRFLRDGDVVRIAAPGLGELTNRVVAAPLAA